MAANTTIIQCQTRSGRMRGETPSGHILQGLLDIDKEVYLKNVQGPFYLASTSSAAAVLPAKVGVRYFIHSVTITARNIATDTSTGVQVSGYSNNGYVYLLVGYLVPSVANQVSATCILDIITDDNKAVNAAVITADPTAMTATIAYREVPA